MKRYAQRPRVPSPENLLPVPARKVLAAAGFRLLRGINTVGRLALADGRALIPLDRAMLLEKCRRMTCLDDFGGEDFLPPLDILLRSLEEDARLNLVGRITVHREMLRLLCNRLRLQRDRQIFPAIAQERIRQPLFITGLPRSGTTFLHALLARPRSGR